MIKLLIAALAGAAIVFILTVLIFGLIGAYRENEKLKEELSAHEKTESAPKHANARGFADIPLHDFKQYVDAFGGNLDDFKMIVRCKNCIHLRYDDESETFTCTLRSGAVVKTDGFCSEGERILK